MNIKENLGKLILASMKNRDTIAADTYRAVKTAFMNFETSKERMSDHKVLDEPVQISIVQKMVKERADTSKVYMDNGRPELAEKEQREIEILSTLLPKIATVDEVAAALNESYPDGIEQKQMGVVIKEFKSRFAGFDGATLATLVKNIIRK